MSSMSAIMATIIIICMEDWCFDTKRPVDLAKRRFSNVPHTHIAFFDKIVFRCLMVKNLFLFLLLFIDYVCFQGHFRNLLFPICFPMIFRLKFGYDKESTYKNIPKISFGDIVSLYVYGYMVISIIVGL